MIEKLLELLLWVLGPIIAIIVAAVIAWVLRRAIRAGLEAKYGGAAGPVWLLSAAVIGLLLAAIALRALWTPSHWLDPFVLTWLGRWVFDSLPSFRQIVFPFSAFWLAGAVVVVTGLYSLLALLIAWLLGPPPLHTPEAGPRRKGMPPPSAATSAREPRMGLLMSLDSAASSATAQWLYANLGYWSDPRPGSEPRFRSWLEPIHKSLGWIRWFSLPVVAFGVTSALAWIGTALLHDALGHILALPPAGPEEEEEEEEVEEEVEPPEILAEADLVARISQDLGGTGACLRPLSSSSSRQARATSEPWPASSLGPLWQSVLDRWQGGRSGDVVGFRAWEHQLEAARRTLDGDDLLLQSLPGSGRTTIADLLTAHTALCHAGAILVIAPDDAECGERVSAIKAFGRSGGWHWIITAHDLASDGISGLDPLVEQPEIVVGTVGAVERHFMAVSGNWDIFLSNLSLVIVSEIDRYDGARAASLGALCRRLLVLAEDLGASPVVHTSASGLWNETARLAEEVTSRTLGVVDEGSNGAPRPEQAIYLAAGGEGLTDRLRDHIEEAGWRCLIRGREPTGHSSQGGRAPESRGEDSGPFRRPRALLAPVSSRHLAVATSELVHHPLDAAPDERVLVIRVHQPDHPLTTTLFAPARTSDPMADWTTASPLLACGWGNPAAAAQALRRALAERESTPKELEQRHGARATDHEVAVLAEQGLLSQREASAPDQESGLPVPRTLLRLSDPSKVRLESAAAVVTSHPLELYEGSTNEPVMSIDRVRSEVAFVPGSVFLRRGRRLRISEESDRLVAEPEPEQVWSQPIRSLEVELDDWAPQPLRLGGTTRLEVGRGPVALSLSVEGVRRYGFDGELLDERLFTTHLSARYPCRALVIRFAEQPEGQTQDHAEGEAEGATADDLEGAVHAVTHALRAALPLVERSGPFDLDVAPLTADERGAPGIVIVDLHPFGAGYADALRTGALRRLLRMARAILVDDERVAAATLCRSASGRWAEPDGAGARALLDQTVGHES